MFIAHQTAVRSNLSFMDASIEAMHEAGDVSADFLKMYQGR